MRKIRQFDDHHLPTYSNVLEWLDKLPMRAASAAQWISTIRAAKDIRKEEIDRTGLVNALANSDAEEKIYKSDLLDFASYNLNFCHISLVTEGMSDYQPSYRFKSVPIDALPKRVREDFAGQELLNIWVQSSLGYRILGVRFSELFGIRDAWMLFDERWTLIRPSFNRSGMFHGAMEAVDALYSVAREKFSNFASHAPLQRYEQYSWLGKNANYREWLVLLEDWPEQYLNDHFLMQNLVLHIRTAEWSDTDGNKLLLVDEIQSDWHAQGREYGYLRAGAKDEEKVGAVPDAPFTKEWHELGIKISLNIALSSGITRVGFMTGEQHCERWNHDYEGLRLLYDKQLPNAVGKLAKRFNCHFGWTEITRKRPKNHLSFKRGTGWIVKMQDGKDQEKTIKNKTVALRYWQANAQPKAEQVRLLEISPTLSEMIKTKGVPLFGWWGAITA